MIVPPQATLSQTLHHIKPTPHICKEDICSRTLKRVRKQVTDLSPRGRGETENPGDPDDEQDRNDEQGPARHD